MKVAPLYDVKNRLSEFARDSQRRPVIITRHGKPYAALVGIEDQDVEVFLLAHHPAFLAEIDRAATRAEVEGTTPLDVVEHELARRESRRKKRRPKTRIG